MFRVYGVSTVFNLFSKCRALVVFRMCRVFKVVRVLMVSRVLSWGV